MTLGDMMGERDERPEIRRAQRVLLMVHELHKRGYQRLRIVPGMAPSGCHWRCSITPITNILDTHGAMPVNYEECIHYSTSEGNNYFQWEDAQHDTARQLATKFIERFPKAVEAGCGSDWGYVGWYVEMLGFAERGHLPVAYADNYGEAPYYLAKDRKRKLSLPPLDRRQLRDVVKVILEKVEVIVDTYSAREAPIKAHYMTSGLDPLWPRFQRAVLNQVEDGGATLSRYEIWANTVRANIREAIVLHDSDRKDEANRLLTRAVNSMSAFAEVQRLLDVENN